jgi:hypothetical protein
MFKFNYFIFFGEEMQRGPLHDNAHISTTWKGPIVDRPSQASSKQANKFKAIQDFAQEQLCK